eukprot:scaffold92725_cov32-Phaeocystis_antarctica.AAC.1
MAAWSGLGLGLGVGAGLGLGSGLGLGLVRAMAASPPRGDLSGGSFVPINSSNDGRPSPLATDRP